LQDTVIQNNNRRVSSCSPEHKKHHSMRRHTTVYRPRTLPASHHQTSITQYVNQRLKILHHPHARRPANYNIENKPVYNEIGNRMK